MKKVIMFFVFGFLLINFGYLIVAENNNSKNQTQQNNFNDDLNKTNDYLNKTNDDLNKTNDYLNKTNDDLNKTNDYLNKTNNQNNSNNFDMNETEDSAQKCKMMYWFDFNQDECKQKEFCGMYMYKGLKTFKNQIDCNQSLLKKFQHRERNKFKIYSNQLECPGNCTCTGSTTKCTLPDGSKEMTIEAGKSGNTIFQIKGINASTNVTLYKDEDGKVVGIFKNKTKTIILPDEVFQKIKEKLNAQVEAGKIELDGEGNYQIETKKRVKFLGIFPSKERVKIELNSETGEIIKTKTSWWGFLAKDIKKDS